MKWVLSKHFDVALVISLEFRHVGMLTETLDLFAVGVILVVEVVGSGFQILKPLFDES